VIIWFAVAPGRPGLWLAVGLLTGGALGNLIDRVRDSAVTDFLDPPLWPAFNVADIAVTLGALTLALVVLRIPAADDDERSGGGS
jgi:signal peptidase II